MAKPSPVAGTAETPWELKTESGTSDFLAWRDAALDPPALVVQVGKTQLRYHLRCIEDLHAMLKTHGDWMPLGGVDEQKPAADGTVETWGRSPNNPVKGWYGIKRGQTWTGTSPSGGTISTCWSDRTHSSVCPRQSRKASSWRS